MDNGRYDDGGWSAQPFLPAADVLGCCWHCHCLSTEVSAHMRIDNLPPPPPPLIVIIILTLVQIAISETVCLVCWSIMTCFALHALLGYVLRLEVSPPRQNQVASCHGHAQPSSPPCEKLHISHPLLLPSDHLCSVRHPLDESF
jgi:hypothetical protein